MLRNPLILGKNGQLGRALAELLPDATALDSKELDLTLIEMIPETLARHKPSIIFNAAAYTAVDKAEEEEPIAHLVNAEAPAVMAAYCKVKEIPLIHYSTDYVFDGSGSEPWREDQTPAPLNAYGRSKLKGEELMMASGGDAMIFRTSWVYDAQGQNFLNTMLRLGAEREELAIVSDQIGRPTYAPHLAKMSLQAVENAAQSARFPTGIYHLTGGGDFASWKEFAEVIFEAYEGELAIQKVKAQATKDYPTPAKRPLNSRLDCSKAHNILGIEMPDWREGLKECLAVRD